MCVIIHSISCTPRHTSSKKKSQGNSLKQVKKEKVFPAVMIKLMLSWCFVGCPDYNSFRIHVRKAWRQFLDVCCIWSFGAIWMVAHRHVHWISVDMTLCQLNTYTHTHRAFCLGRVMAGDTILRGSGKAGSGVTAVLGHAVLSGLKAVTAKPQASACWRRATAWKMLENTK